MKRKRALWASTAARGGISTFVSTMQETALWQDWNVRLISTHTNGTALSRIAMFINGFSMFALQLVIDRPDVVHLHTAAYGSFVRKGALAWVAKLFRIPVVLHMHGADFLIFFAEAPKPLQFLIRVTLERVDSLIALGDAWALQLRDIAPDARIVVVPNAVRPGSPVDQRSEASLEVAFIGEIGDRKGTFTLINAWQKMIGIYDGPTPVHLTIVGDGEVDRARNQATELGLTATVTVRGWMAHADVKNLLAKTQILVLPSRDEGQPMAILEAMARGLCVVASTVGGIPELLDDGCGVLVKPDDVAGLANAIAQVVSDRDARVAMGHNAFHRIRDRFDVDVVSRCFDDLYRQLSR